MESRKSEWRVEWKERKRETPWQCEDADRTERSELGGNKKGIRNERKGGERERRK